MRILIFSDVHANWEALQALAAVAAAPGFYDASLCLGDIVGYGGNPNETAAWVQGHAPVVIRGNHDRACSELYGLDLFNPIAAGAARWTFEALDPRLRAWLAGLPAGPLDWEGLQLVHGSPLDEDQYLIGPGQAEEIFANTSARLVFFGHTHVQGGFALRASRSEGGAAEVVPLAVAPRPNPGEAAPSEVRIALEPGTRYLINPGSIGQPRDGDWRAAFAVYDSAAQSVLLHRIPYDLPGAQAAIRAAGLPPELANRLSRGR